jgi:prepilin-type N-terminal cleavage/methylation domain-containing protein
MPVPARFRMATGKRQNRTVSVKATMLHPTRHTGRGFTLIELLVVVAIIALLISILLPSLKRARDQAKAVVCASSLRVCAQAMLFYNQANQEYFPNSGAWPDPLHPYLLKMGRGKPLPTTVYGTRQVQNVEVFLCSNDPIYVETGEGCSCVNGVWESFIYHTSYMFNPFLAWPFQPTTAGGKKTFVINETDKYNGTYFDQCSHKNEKTPNLQKTTRVKRTSEIVLFTDAGDDDNCGSNPLDALKWDFDDAIDLYYTTDPPILEVHHNSGNNFAYVDQHVEFKKIIQRTGPHDKLGVPLFPFRWVPGVTFSP